MRSKYELKCNDSRLDGFSTLIPNCFISISPKYSKLMNPIIWKASVSGGRSFNTNDDRSVHNTTSRLLTWAHLQRWNFKAFSPATYWLQKTHDQLSRLWVSYIRLDHNCDFPQCSSLERIWSKGRKVSSPNCEYYSQAKFWNPLLAVLSALYYNAVKYCLFKSTQY